MMFWRSGHGRCPAGLGTPPAFPAMEVTLQERPISAAEEIARTLGDEDSALAILESLASYEACDKIRWSSFETFQGREIISRSAYAL